MVEVRRARASDEAAIVLCIEAAYERYRAAGVRLPAVADGVGAGLRDNLVWVAQDESDVMGVLIAVAGEERWHLANLAVHPGFGGRGVARSLIARMEDAAARVGVRDLALTTHAAMPDNVAIYTRLGWVETGREGDKAFMGRRLSGASEE